MVSSGPSSWLSVSVLLLPTLLLFLLCPIGAQQCLTLPPSSACSSVLPYQLVTLNSAFSCLSNAEYALKQSPILVSLLYEASPSTACAPAVALLLCQSVYAPCAPNSSTTIPCPATSQCSAVDTACPAALQQSLIAPFMSSLPAALQLPALCNASTDGSSASCDPVPLPAASSFQPAPSCLAYSGSICHGVVNYPVYVPASMSIRAVEAELSVSLSSALLVAPVASGCRDALLKQMCSIAFLPCDTTAVQRATGLPLSYPFPRLPCASACEETQATCGAFLEQFPQLAAATSCNTSNLLPAYQTCSGAVIPAQPDYPAAATTFAVLTADNNTVAVSSSCYAPPTTVNVSIACPAPLVSAPSMSDDGILGGSCAVPYKSLLWSADEWTMGDTLMVAFSALSFVSLSVIMLTWTIFPVKRRQHHLHMFMLCQFLISLVFIVSLLATHSKPSNIGLPYPTSPSPVDSTVCVFQSAMLVFVVNAGVFWWTFIAFHLFLKVVLRCRLTTSHNNILTAVYHAVTWLVSLLLTLIGGVGGWYGRSSVVPWCFFRDDSPASADWLLFYVPIGVRGVVGCVLMLAVMVGLYKQGRLVSGMRARGGKVGSGRRQTNCCNNVRPLLFVGQFFIIFFFLIVFRAILHFHQTTYTDSTTDYVTCLLTAADTASCGTRPQLGPSVALFYLIILTTAGQGLVPGMIYLSQSTVWALWRGLLSGEGVNGVSRTRGGFDSSVRTESKVGMSVNAMARRMSNKGLTGVGTMTSGYAIRKGSGSGSAGSGTTVQASPVSQPIAFTVSDDRFNSARSPSPFPTAHDTIETNYAGLRVSRSDSGGPPQFALTPQWYGSSGADNQQPDWSVQLASITPSMYNSLPAPIITRSTFTAVPQSRPPPPPIAPFELLALPIAPDETRSVQLNGPTAATASRVSDALGREAGSGSGSSSGGSGVEMVEVRRDGGGSVRMELPMEDVRADEEEYRVTLHVDE